MRQLLSETDSKISNSQHDISKVNNNIDELKENIGGTLNSLEGLASSFDEINGTINNLKIINPLIAPSLIPITDELAAARVKVADLEQMIEDNVDEMNNLTVLSANSISAENFNIDKFYSKLDSNQEEVNKINNTAHEIEATYLDIKEKVDGVDIRFKTLKKEFISNPLTLEQKFIFGEITYFQYLTPAIIALSLFFIGVMMTVLNIVNERTKKTLFKLTTTPLTKSELLTGKFLIFLLVGLIESTYFILLSIFVFGVEINGSFFASLFVLLLLMGSSIGLGFLISALVKSLSQAVMIIPLILMPAILISNIFAPIEVMPKYMLYLANLSPVYHANIVLREIIIKGANFSSVILPLVILFFYSLATLVLGIIISKKRM